MVLVTVPTRKVFAGDCFDEGTLTPNQMASYRKEEIKVESRERVSKKGSHKENIAYLGGFQRILFYR